MNETEGCEVCGRRVGRSICRIAGTRDTGVSWNDATICVNSHSNAVHTNRVRIDVGRDGLMGENGYGTFVPW